MNEDLTNGGAEPTAPVAALELLADVLAQADEASVSDDFYSRLAGAVCRLAGMKRALIFRWDDASRRATAAGSHGVPVEAFANQRVTVETARAARQALVEDRVIEVAAGEDLGIPPEFVDLIEGRPLSFVPIVAAGRWIGVMIVDPGPDGYPLDAGRRDLLWTLGKTLALASMSRVATHQRERAHQLEERIDLARDIHDGVVQRLFGVSLVLSSERPLDREAQERAAKEVQEALAELRSALQRPLGRPSRATGTTLEAELDRLRIAHPDLKLTVAGEIAVVPEWIEPLAQSVLAEAVRNARKHAQPEQVTVRVTHSDGAFVLEVANDGVPRRRNAKPGVGLKLAAVEALQLGGLVEFGRRSPGTWHVRLVVPDDEGDGE